MQKVRKQYAYVMFRLAISLFSYFLLFSINQKIFVCSGIQKLDTQNPETPENWNFSFRFSNWESIWILVFRHHLNNRPVFRCHLKIGQDGLVFGHQSKFGNRTDLYHLNTCLVWYPDQYCIVLRATGIKMSKFHLYSSLNYSIISFFVNWKMYYNWLMIWTHIPCWFKEKKDNLISSSSLYL